MRFLLGSVPVVVLCLTPAIVPGQDPGLVLTLTDAEGGVGNTVQIEVLFDNQVEFCATLGQAPVAIGILEGGTQTDPTLVPILRNPLTRCSRCSIFDSRGAYLGLPPAWLCL